MPIDLYPLRFELTQSWLQPSLAGERYDYALVDGNGESVDRDTRIAALDQALVDGRITEDQRVAAKNSVLYAIALYISLQGVPS